MTSPAFVKAWPCCFGDVVSKCTLRATVRLRPNAWPTRRPMSWSRIDVCPMGGRICLINVPEHLESITSVWESTHDMPMRERVGARLSAELAELWS